MLDEFRKRCFGSVLGCVLALAGAPTPPACASDTLASMQLANWGLAEGLPQISVQALAQTRDGYLWVGTQDGLARFDGVAFTKLGPETSPELVHAVIWSLHVDRTGTLWIGTMDGAFRLRDGMAVRVPEIPRIGIPCMVEDSDGAVWVGTYGAGLFRFNGDRHDHWTTQHGLPDDLIVGLSGVDGQTMHIAVKGALVRFAEGRFEPIVLPLLPAGERIQSVAVDRSGTLWLGATNGLFHRDRATWREVLGPDAQSLRYVRSLRLLADGRLLIGSLGQVSTADSGTHVLRDTLNEQPQVMSTFEDREGSIWIGVLSRGLFRLTHRNVRHIGVSGNSADEKVMALLTLRDGVTWVATAKNVVRFDARGEPMAAPVAPELTGVCALTTDRDGMILASTGGAIFRVQPQQPAIAQRLPVTLDANACAIHVDATGRLWLGSTTGITVVSALGQRTLTEREGLSDSFVKAIAPGTGNRLWIATRKGLTQLMLTDLTARTEAGVDAVTTTTVRDAGDHGLWVGTHGAGLLRLRDGRTDHYTVRNGLPSDVICGVHVEADGRVWASTYQGLVAFWPDADADGGHAHHPHGPAYVMDESAGMASRECSAGVQSPITMRADGTLWFATIRGVAAVDPAHLHSNAVAPEAIIESFVVDRAQLSLRQDSPLSAGPHSLEIRYTATSLAAAQKSRFRYRLDGYDRDWIDADGRRIAYYTNLPAGDYAFQVLGSNNDGVWSTRAATLNFAIAPYVHQRWWFRLLLAMVIAAFFTHLLRLRAREARARNAVLQERLRLSRELHDKLSQTMTGVALQLDAASDALDADPDSAAPYIHRATELVRDGIDETRRTLQGLRPSELDAAGLAAALQRNILHLTQGTAVVVKMAVRGTPVMLSPNIELALFRIGQEAAGNAIRHGLAQRIDVIIEYSLSGIRLIVRDNGKGFDDRVPHDPSGIGLCSMRERVHGLGGTVEVKSTPGKGTTVDVFVPIPATRPDA